MAGAEAVCGEVNKFCLLTDEQSDRVGLFRNLDLDIAVIDRGEGFYECVPKDSPRLRRLM